MLIPMKVDYGVRMLVYLAQQPEGAYASTSDIASARHIPEPYLLHICSELQKAGMIQSRRGPQGGHRLAVSADEITISDVVASLDYSLAPLDCVDDADECKLAGSCAQRGMWSDVEKILLSHLESVRVSDLVAREGKPGQSPVKASFAGATRVS